MNLDECTKISFGLREIEKRIASGNPGNDLKTILKSASDAIDFLVEQVKIYRNDKMREEDPLRPMWPNWD